MKAQLGAIRTLLRTTLALLAAPAIALADPPRMDWKQEIEAAIAPVNAKERARRVEYHAYLVESGRDDGETLEQHIERYAQLAKMAGPASDASIDALREISPVALPDGLVQFYRSAGGFDGGAYFSAAETFSPARLLQKQRSDRRYEKIRSIGLVDMIRASWGNDRFEFDPASGEGLSQEQVDALNARYAVLGWRQKDDGEAFEYLIVDGAGGFDLLYYHQDDFATLYTDDLEPMVAGRAGRMTFAEAFRSWLRQPVDPLADE